VTHGSAAVSTDHHGPSRLAGSTIETVSAPKSNDQRAPDSLEGALADLPELTWEDFERASELARRDLETGGEDELRPA
jgi:hypothetical protein